MLVAKIKDNVIEKICIHTEMFPYVSFPVTGVPRNFLQDNSCMEVSVWKEHLPETQKLQECMPYIQGEYVYTVEVVDQTPEELQAKKETKKQQIRNFRNQLLSSSDWTQGKDVPQEISEPWAAYRQQLRDLTLQPEFPDNVEYPTIPA